MRKLVLQSVLAIGASGVMLFAQSTPPAQPPAAQGTMSTDSDLTSKVRQGLMDDTVVGTSAHKIRVSTRNGMVTLRGKVDSAREKDAAVAKAKQIAGDSNVTDEITVKK